MSESSKIGWNGTVRSRPFQRGASERAKMYFKETRGRRVRAEGAHAAAKLSHFTKSFSSARRNFLGHFKFWDSTKKLYMILFDCIRLILGGISAI